MGEFSMKTFPKAGSIEHLKKLKIEADEAISEPSDIKEYVDCLLALMAAGYKAGIGPDEMIQVAEDKFKILKQREWTEKDGIYQHVI